MTTVSSLSNPRISQVGCIIRTQSKINRNSSLNPLLSRLSYPKVFYHPLCFSIVACGLIPKPPALVPRSRLLVAFGESTRRPNEVHWWVLHQRDSYDAFLDARNLEKYAGTLAAEGNINDAITGEYRIICAYEILRVYLGQESNRYPRLRVVWYKMDTEKVRRQGFFYTALARFLFRNPDLQNLITPNTIGQIASRWELGSKLTIAHVEPNHPSAPLELDSDHIGRVTLSTAKE